MCFINFAQREFREAQIHQGLLDDPFFAHFPGYIQALLEHLLSFNRASFLLENEPQTVAGHGRAKAIPNGPADLQAFIQMGFALLDQPQFVLDAPEVEEANPKQANIADRLYLTGGLNVEASSAFGADERWQLFPRLGVSYIASQQPGWASGSLGRLFSTLRLRGSYGETGGQPPGAYQRFSNYNTVSYAGKAGLVASTIAGNPNLKPEKSRQFSAGVDYDVNIANAAACFGQDVGVGHDGSSNTIITLCQAFLFQLTRRTFTKIFWDYIKRSIMARLKTPCDFVTRRILEPQEKT